MVEGYLAPLVEGETLESLFNDGWDPPPALRLRMAALVCSSVEVLEAGELVHADLSMSNVMVIDHGTVEPDLRLIDFDGFHHPEVPTVPCSGERGGRGFGQDGYRHRTYSARDDTVIVTSDRCAMAALAFEIIALRPGDLDRLSRSTILDQRDVDAGRPSAPAAITARWPEGWSMLSRAFAAPSPAQAPAPAEWFEALIRLATSAPRSHMGVAPGLASSDALPSTMLRIVENEVERRVHLRAETNSFGAVSPKLAWLSYVRSRAGVTLFGRTPHPLFLRRAGRLSRLKDDVSLVLEPGDEIKWTDFDIEVG
jgi:hypothetical protein